ncbi:flavin reductase family protein [Variovorax defluvii]|uniref:Flavin reductase family protein n=1 Tax=Variovorax defluvii TaxID=913761 RepID=A0ABP8H522_9BURK
MEIDIQGLSAGNRYKLMASLITPRPIALITTVSENGITNAAPFSLFNMVGEDPPLVLVSINPHPDGRRKDTAANIRRTREFVVHMSDEHMAQKMQRCSDVLPKHLSELEHTGLTATPSRMVSPGRIAEAPVAFECSLYHVLETPSREIFIGQVMWLHVREGLIDSRNWRVDLDAYSPIGRLGGWAYTGCRDRFEMK